MFSLADIAHRYGDTHVHRVDAWRAGAGELAHGAQAWQAEGWGVVALALGAGIIATVIPAWRAYRQDVGATLADG